MANIYNSNITTRYLEPVNHSNHRTEYRLDNNSVYLSNLRLINVGATADSHKQATQMRGANAIIKSIALYSGNQLLDQVTDLNLWETYTRHFHSNERQIVEGILCRGSGGLVAVTDDEIDSAGTALEPNSSMIYNRQNKVDHVFPSAAGGVDLKKASWMSVQSLLSFLGNSVHLPTGIIKDLRLVVIYNSLAEFNKASGNNNATSVTPNKPLLVADEVNPSEMRDAMVRDYKGVNYSPVEQERVIATAAPAPDTNAPPVEKSQNFLLTGFNNKFVEKLIVYQQATDAGTWQDGNVNHTRTGAYGCPPQLNPVIQWRVNGANKYPGIGLEGHNRALALIVDHVGDSSFVPGGNQIGVVGNANVYNDSIGQLPYHNGYTCMPIEDAISELHLTFTRSGVHGNADTTQELYLNIFGIVRKQLSLRDNGPGFRIAYV